MERVGAPPTPLLAEHPLHAATPRCRSWGSSVRARYRPSRLAAAVPLPASSGKPGSLVGPSNVDGFAAKDGRLSPPRLVAPGRRGQPEKDGGLHQEDDAY